MGGGDYKRDAPPLSYIDVNDFSTVKKLADYLRRLDKRTDKYLQYFRWKQEYNLYQYDAWCEVCRKLHDFYEGPVKIYSNVTKWYYYDDLDQPLCKNISDTDFFGSIYAK